MSDPRLSIIPAGAVTDARLEPRDLQVLCLLGRHTDNMGWCSRSQVKMARELSCGRATVQRALERLEEAGWIEHRPEIRPDGGDRAHFYRVILDVAEPIRIAEESSAETPASAEGGVPIGGQGVPAIGGQGVPTHERAPIRTTPINEEIEREARAGAKEPDPETDQDFQALLAKVVKAGGSQPIGRCFGQWRKLDEAERKAALDGWDVCLAGWSRGGRKHPYGLETYLRDRMWTQEAAPAGDGGPKVMLALRSGEWFSFFWTRFIAGDLNSCRSMVSMGKQRVGKGVPVEDVPSADAVKAMPRIEKTGPAWRAWRQKLEAAGIRIDDDSVPVYVWVPSEWPKGMEEQERRAG